MRLIDAKRLASTLVVAIAAISGCGADPGSQPIAAPATPPPANDPGPPSAATAGLPPKPAK